MNRERRRRWP